MKNKTFSIFKCNKEEAESYLRLIENDFDTRVSERIDIEFYAKKWAENAKFLSLKDEKEYLVSLIIYYENLFNSSLYITEFVVTRLYRHRGIGHIMLDYLIGNYSINFRYVDLEVAKDNKNAYQFYIREGFRIIEEKDVKYLMRKDI